METKESKIIGPLWVSGKPTKEVQPAKPWEKTIMSKEQRIATGLVHGLTEDEKWQIGLEYQAKLTWEARDPEIIEAMKVGVLKVEEWSHTLCPHSWGKYSNLGSKAGCQRCWEELITGLV